MAKYSRITTNYAHKRKRTHDHIISRGSVLLTTLSLQCFVPRLISLRRTYTTTTTPPHSRAHAHTFSIHTTAVDQSRPHVVACRVSCCRCRCVLHETQGQRGRGEIDREGHTPMRCKPFVPIRGNQLHTLLSPLLSRSLCSVASGASELNFVPPRVVCS